MKPNIMFVDDSYSVLESLKWIFKDEPYYLFAFDNPFAALRAIKTLEWAIVVADLYMPYMDGLEFLKMVQKKSPHTMGIIMTGYTENSELLNKLYPNCVYQFVKKPLDNREIKQAVETAITQYEINVGSK
jgi:DNA-binding NtrC family response regulator